MTAAPLRPSPLPTTVQLRVLPSMAEVDAAAWDGLLAQQEQPTPFMRHAYLLALESSGSATAKTGWQPCHITLWQGKQLLLQAAWGDPEGRRPLVRAQAQAPLATLTEAEALGNAVAAQLRAGGALGA